MRTFQNYRLNGLVISAQQDIKQVSTKTHALSDALGNPVKFILSPKSDHDITHAEKFIKDLKNAKILSDKEYDSEKFVKFLEKNDCEALIPYLSNSKKKRVFDKYIFDKTIGKQLRPQKSEFLTLRIKDDKEG